jgi:hypothetical protein
MVVLTMNKEEFTIQQKELDKELELLEKALYFKIEPLLIAMNNFPWRQIDFKEERKALNTYASLLPDNSIQALILDGILKDKASIPRTGLTVYTGEDSSSFETYLAIKHDTVTSSTPLELILVIDRSQSRVNSSKSKLQHFKQIMEVISPIFNTLQDEAFKMQLQSLHNRNTSVKMQLSDLDITKYKLEKV